MRPLLLIFLFCCRCLAEQSPPYGEGAPPLRNNGFEIIWEAPTGHLPRSLWTYRVLPSNFSGAAISNLVAFGSFSTINRVRALGPGPVHPRQICYADGHRCLGIYPHLGFIEYRDELAVRPGLGEGVPDRNAALILGTNYLSLLGIDLTEIAPDPVFAPAKAWIFKPEGTVTNIPSCRVSFGRRIDGVDFYNRSEGCDIRFGSYAKISYLYLSWRNLERHKSYPTATPETIMKWMRAGKCAWQWWSPEAQSLDSSIFKKVTVKSITPYYHGVFRSEQQNWVYPFASLETSVVMFRTNRVPPVVGPAEWMTREEYAKKTRTIVQTNTETVFILSPIIDN